MLVGVSQKYDFGWNVQVEKFTNLESAEWAKEVLEDASIHTLVDGGLDTEFSPSYITKQMG